LSDQTPEVLQLPNSQSLTPKVAKSLMVGSGRQRCRSPQPPVLKLVMSQKEERSVATVSRLVEYVGTYYQQQTYNFLITGS